jgi:hypothetical protein
VFAEASTDQLSRQPALVFDCIMKQGRDRLILIATVRDDQTGHCQQVCNVRCLRPLFFLCLAWSCVAKTRAFSNRAVSSRAIGVCLLDLDGASTRFLSHSYFSLAASRDP